MGNKNSAKRLRLRSLTRASFSSAPGAHLRPKPTYTFPVLPTSLPPSRPSALYLASWRHTPKADTTNHDLHPPQPTSPSSNAVQGVSSNVASSLDHDILDIVPKHSNHSSLSDATICSASSKSTPRSSATACVASPVQAFNATEDDYADPENDDDPEDDPDDDPDDDGPNEDPGNESEQDEAGVLEDHVLEDHATASSLSSKTRSHSDPTASASPPAQSASGAQLNSRHRGRNVTATASSAESAPGMGSKLNNGGRTVTATACAASPAQALPRDVLRGQNPNDRSLSDRTDCAAVPAQPATPQKPKPDADGFIWHPRPGYPNQEISEPDAQGRVAYKYI